MKVSAAFAAAAAPTVGEFTSSFEADDPQPAWTNAVDTDAAGGKRAAGVRGPAPSGIAGNLLDDKVAVSANGENQPGGEVKENLRDGDLHSKWLVREKTGWVQFDLPQPRAVVNYALSAANDARARDPRDWTLQGSLDGKSWAKIDARADQTFARRFQTLQFQVDNRTAYRHYRLEITRNAGADIVQLAEVQLGQGGQPPAPPPDMATAIDKGPSSAPAAKTGVGFTGKKALHYAGTHTAAGPAFSHNKVFEVDLKVTPDSELEYLIFPELSDDDLRYPSTYAAVDLAFSDGSHLSELGAFDQHGFGLNRAGPGRLPVAVRQPVEQEVGGHRPGRGGQDHPQDPGGLRRPRGPRALPGLGGRHPHHQRPRAPAPGPPLGPRAHHPRHPRQQRLFPGQQHPRHRGAVRLQLLDAGHQRRLAELALRIPPGQQRRQPAGPAGLRRQPRAQPLDGRSTDLPGDALGGGRGAQRRPGRSRPAVRTRQRGGAPPPLHRHLRQRAAGRDRPRRPRRPLPLHLPRRRRQPDLRQRQQQRHVAARPRRPRAQRHLRRAQRAVHRGHPPLRPRHLRPPRRGQRDAPRRRRPRRHRLPRLRHLPRPGRHHAHRHLADRHRSGPAQPGPRDPAPRHLRARPRPGPEAVGRAALGHRGQRRQPRPAHHAVFEPLPPLPLPQLGLRERRQRRPARLPARRAVRHQHARQRSQPHRRPHRRRQGLRQQRLLGHLPHHLGGLHACSRPAWPAS